MTNCKSCQPEIATKDYVCKGCQPFVEMEKMMKASDTLEEFMKKIEVIGYYVAHYDDLDGG